MSDRTLVYTAITGGYDNLRAQPEQDVPCWWFAMMDHDSCLPGDHLPEPWTYHPLVNDDLGSYHSRALSRWPKCTPHDIISGPRYAVWIDATVQILRRDFISWAVSHLEGTDGLVAWQHPSRDDIFEEARAVAQFQAEQSWEKYRGEPQGQQVTAYRANGLPKPSGLWACGCLVWDLESPAAASLGQAWFAEQLRWNSWLDQLSLPFVVWQHDFKIGTFSLPEYGNDYVRFEEHVRND